MVGTPWEPPENLNRVAPAGVSLVVTDCSQGPLGSLNSAGEKLSPRIGHSASAFPGTHIHLDIYRFIEGKMPLQPLGEQICIFTYRLSKVVRLLIDLDSGPHRDS